MINLAKKLFPINRSLSGAGVRQTLEILKDEYQDLKIFSIPSGTDCFDWRTPPEWNISNAWVKNEAGKVIIDFKNNNLHVLGYSTPIDKIIDRAELFEHIHTLKDQPNAIPYVTSYYKKTWGFCMAHNDFENIEGNRFHVFIDSELNENGNLNYGEIYISGESKKEILLSTYICHPSMANNELSGPIVAMDLAKKFNAKIGNKLSIRILFLPETIGAIYYISKNLQNLKENVVGGFVLTCCGDRGKFSYIPSPYGETLADRAALFSLDSNFIDYEKYSYLDRGSDERQYCWPGIDLPVCSITRTKYGKYPEYHTSLDNLEFIDSSSLEETSSLYENIIDIININDIFKCNVLCEPMLSKRGLYPTTSLKANYSNSSILDFLVYCNGSNDLIDICTMAKINSKDCIELVKTLIKNKLIEKK
jgi:aminopeptidase-like protein